MIRTVLAQRGTLWCAASVALLGQEADFRVVGQVGCVEGIGEAARREGADVVVLDAEMPDGAEIEALCARLCESCPELKILVLMERWVGDGAGLCRLAPRVGLLGTESSPAQLFEGIRRLSLGKPVLDAGLAVAALTAGSNPLTDREREVLRKSVDGAPAKAIAAELFLSIGTVRNYLPRAVAKTGPYP